LVGILLIGAGRVQVTNTTNSGVHRPLEMATRWGVIGTSNISHDFAVAMSTLPRTEHLITAVASKDKARSQEFAEQFDIPKAYDSYSLVATDNEVGEMIQL